MSLLFISLVQLDAYLVINKVLFGLNNNKILHN